MNLYEKILAVAGEIKSIDKDMKVGTGSYAYKAVSDLSVTKRVKEAEEKYKLVSIPVKQDVIHHEVIRILEKEKERLMYHFVVKMTTRIVDVEKPSDFLEIETFGHGLDVGDKGFGKASTYARKYALLNAYKIATGEDPDENKSEPKDTEHKEEKRDIVFAYMEKDIPFLQKILKYFNVEVMEDLSKKQTDTIYNNLLKKNLI